MNTDFLDTTRPANDSTPSRSNVQIVERCNQLIGSAHTFFTFEGNVAYIAGALRREIDPAQFDAALRQAELELDRPGSSRLVPDRALQIIGDKISVCQRINILSCRIFADQNLRILLIRYLSPDLAEHRLNASEIPVLMRALAPQCASPTVWEDLQSRVEATRHELLNESSQDSRNKSMSALLDFAERSLMRHAS